MPNWCCSTIAFYQEDGGNARAEAFYADILKYQNFKDSDGKHSSWVGHWLQSNRMDIETINSRCFFVSCELLEDHIRVEMETAWEPLPEVWDLMAEKYELSYVYIAEESGNEVYVNTDATGRFFTTRYMASFYNAYYEGPGVEVMKGIGKRLREFDGETMYFDSWEEVEKAFKELGLSFADIAGLNKELGTFKIKVYEYSRE